MGGMKDGADLSCFCVFRRNGLSWDMTQSALQVSSGRTREGRGAPWTAFRRPGQPARTERWSSASRPGPETGASCGRADAGGMEQYSKKDGIPWRSGIPSFWPGLFGQGYDPCRGSVSAPTADAACAASRSRSCFQNEIRYRVAGETEPFLGSMIPICRVQGGCKPTACTR